MRRSRLIKRSIFIACEGQTEERYFNSIAEVINDDEKYSVKAKTLEIEDGTPQDPLNLVKEAIKVRDEEGHDEAWAVFDKDRPNPNNNQLGQAFQLANTSGITIAYSSIAFEHWVLLHFERNSMAFTRSDCSSRGQACVCNGAICVCTYLKSTVFPSYKKASYKLYTNLKDKNITAVENAAWLKFQMRNYLSQSLNVQPPYTINPYTDVDSLIIKLLEIDRVIFSDINISQTINRLTVSVVSRIGNVVKLRITNNGEVAYIVNNQCDFKVKDQDQIIYSHNVQATVQIDPNQTKDADLIFAGASNNGLEFRMKDSNLILIVPI
jgi:hypothetical protein